MLIRVAFSVRLFVRTLLVAVKLMKFEKLIQREI